MKKHIMTSVSLFHLLILVVAFSSQLIPFCIGGGGLNQRLLVISFDGFREAYLNGTFLPWFNDFAETGVISHKMESIFPSDTFPNHWSIVTGMYAESHGIVANEFFDPKLNRSFTMANEEVFWWNQTEPIWTTARRKGKTTSVSFWPGSTVQLENGKGTPNYYRPIFDANLPFELLINDTVSYLTKENVDLAFMYFHEPDTTGHQAGTGSLQLKDKLQRMDWYLSYILISLENVGLGMNKLNVIICADHGMTNITKRLWISNYVDMKNVESIPAQGAVMMIRPKPGQTAQLMAQLVTGGEVEGGAFRAYLKTDLPAQFHYSNNDRISEIVIVCNLGFYMIEKHKYAEEYPASHGYDPKEPEMRPLFMARGPAFKKGGYQAKNKFETKDIYAIISHVVGIVPDMPTNASLEFAKDIFISEIL